MLAIRMQRRGRKGHAHFRVIVQEAQLSPTSGRVVAALGSYDPHTKTTVLDVEKAAHYLEHGAQPSERVVKLLVAEKVKLPKWVAKLDTKKQSAIRNPDKLRKNQPQEAAPAEEPAAAPVETEAATEATETETPAADEAPITEETPVPEEKPAEEEAAAEEAPTDEKSDNKAKE